MSVVTIAQYQVYTGDTTTASATVQDRLDLAEEMVQAALGRTLEYGEYTETLRLWPFGIVYPSAIPITSVASSADYELYDTQSLVGAVTADTPFISWDEVDGRHMGERIGNKYEQYMDRAVVTYTGGWTSVTMPARLRFWIAKLAAALDPTAETRPIGANLVRIGDVQVSYQQNQLAGELDQFVPGISKAIRGYHLGRL